MERQGPIPTSVWTFICDLILKLIVVEYIRIREQSLECQCVRNHEKLSDAYGLRWDKLSDKFSGSSKPDPMYKHMPRF